MTLSTALTGTGALTKNGPGTLTLGAGGSATVNVVNGTANWSVGAAGPVHVLGGVVNLPNATSTGALTVNGGTLNLVGGTISARLSGGTAGVITLNNGGTALTFGLGASDSTANTFSGTTYVNGYNIVFSKSSNTPAIGGNIIVSTGNWPVHGLTASGSNVFAAGTVLTFAATNNASDFRLAGQTETLAGIVATAAAAIGQPSYPIIENAGYSGGNDTGIAAGTLIVNGTGTYTYDGSLRDQNGGGNGSLSFTQAGPGTQILISSGINYSGTTSITGGVLRYNTTTLPPGPMTLGGGVLELTSPTSFTRTLGNAAGQVQLTGGTTGFSAFGAPATVTLNNDPVTPILWGSPYFHKSGRVGS